MKERHDDMTTVFVTTGRLCIAGGFCSFGAAGVV